jgi:hypothetical protein
MTPPSANNNHNQHEQIEGMLPFFVANTLPPPEADFVRQHLSGCPRCRQSLTEWFEIAHAVQTEAQAWGVPLPPLAEHVRARVGLKQAPVTAVHVPPEVSSNITITARPASGSRRDGSRTSQRRLPLTLVAAMLTLVLATGIFAAMRRGDQADAPTPEVTVMPPSFTPLPPSETPPPVTPTLSIPTIVHTPSPSSESVEIIPPTAALITLTPRPTQKPIEPTATNEYDIPPGMCVVTNATGLEIYVYTQPYDGAPVAGTLTPNQQVVTWVTSGTGWYQISSVGAGLIGWVKGDQVAFRGSCSDLPLPTPTHTPTVTSETCLAIPNTPTQLMMYYGPGLEYEFATNIPSDARLVVLAHSENGWWQVQFSWEGTIFVGWVDGAGVTVQGTECEAIVIRQPAAASTPVP